MKEVRRKSRPQAVSSDVGFGAWRAPVGIMTAGHTHTDIEINRVEQGHVTYFTSGGYEELGQGDCVIFWAGMPHEVVTSTPGAIMSWAVLPLTWFVQWQLPAAFSDRLLQGEWIRVVPERPELDEALFGRWAEDQLRVRGPETTRVISLELEAWLRRVARSCAVETLSSRKHEFMARGADSGARHIERLASCMAKRYREELSVADIASAAELHPHYAMEIWKDGCGLTLWDYLGRLRLSHAQRLLLSTDWTMERVAEESGFGSRARFYALFKKQVGVSPRRWRAEQLG